MRSARRLRAAWKRADLAARPRAEELEPRLPPGDVLFGGLLARSWLGQGYPALGVNYTPPPPHPITTF